MRPRSTFPLSCLAAGLCAVAFAHCGGSPRAPASQSSPSTSGDRSNAATGATGTAGAPTATASDASTPAAAAATAADATAPPTASATRPAPAAISADLPTYAWDAPAFANATRCARGVCIVPAPPARGASGGTNPEPPTRVIIHLLQPGAQLRFTAASDADVMGVVLVGSVALSMPRATGASATAWNAFFARGGALTARNSARSPTVLVSISNAQRVVAPAAAVRLEVRDFHTVPDLAWADGAFHARIAFEGDTTAASLEVLMGGPDAPVARHNHPASWETLIALQADGRFQHFDSAAGSAAATPSAEEPVTAGSVVHVPVAAFHAWHPRGTEPLVAIQSYTPPGPEQRFRALAAPAATPR